MRVRSILIPTMMLATLPIAALAQTAPLPDAHGADVDMACFTVIAGAAGDAGNDASEKGMLDSATGFFAGRIDARLNHDPVAIRAAVTKMMATMKSAELDAFLKPCIGRYFDALERMRTSANAALGKGK